ncbi:4'-phosphopantetheinyl transferase family protein [Robertkochia sediminum]|uniref:4'-phosphopantetheinyl transferase family protein n=1 Tax=Robertkochia sediminum TaxID=2785326 RepID=UPI001933AAA5|nr:4'-phosphopantetheinyl transferase superfamily protein [Robertkochia sediminum]MBL7473924.1 4'-phosphopantetheinyl transferase superfamily protein [Robertkochia sediminum]
MPLYKTITVSDTTKVLIWKIEESVAELSRDITLTPNCEQRLSDMSSELHQRGFLSVRQLLKVAGYTPAELYYNCDGRPHLTDGKEISITHSFIFSGIIISDRPVGIDIEKQREKIGRIANKFVDYEYSFLDNSHMRELTVVWCIKESLYKLFATRGLSFKQHTQVIPFHMDDAVAKAWIKYRSDVRKYHLDFLEFEGFTAAWATEHPTT